MVKVKTHSAVFKATYSIYQILSLTHNPELYVYAGAEVTYTVCNTAGSGWYQTLKLSLVKCLILSSQNLHSFYFI